MTEKILLVNDLASYGKVALGAMMPVLTHMGYDLYTLPTALVSNTLDYGTFEILDTTQYIEGTLAAIGDEDRTDATPRKMPSQLLANDVGDLA